ncbi:MAG TPA: LCP family protein [Bacilli bacterium]
MSLAIVLVVCAGYYIYSILNFTRNIQDDNRSSKFAQFQQETKQDEPPEWEGKDRVNILLLGGDSRGLGKNEIPRSDTMLIASLDPVTKKAYLFSLLRDTYVPIPGHGSERINAAITLGGPELAMKTVTELTGIPIQYYVYTDFQGFIALIDAIGGIDFYVEKDMHYTSAADHHQYDIDLKKGEQHLDGKTALQYVRFRHDAMSDYARTERQRNFLQAVAQKLKSTTSILKLPRILNAVDPYIETNLSINDMWKLGSLGYKIDTNNVVSVQLPPQDLLREENVGGASVVTVDSDRLKAFVQDTFAPKTDVADGDDNGQKQAGGVPGLSDSAADQQ